MKKLILLLGITSILASCQIRETMILNEDGSGKMSLSIDLNEMMAFSQATEADSTRVNVDTIVRMKDVLVQKKDSIAQLTKENQEELKRLENFNFRSMVNYDTNEMLMDVFLDFKDISEADELMNAFQQSGAFMKGLGNEVDLEDDDDSSDVVAVKFQYKKGKFIRDAYIVDKEKHRVQMDSMKQAESFLKGMTYRLEYTFPNRIKSASIQDAKLSLDGKTIEIQRSFVEYMRNPDILDLEVELENQ